MRPIAVQIAVVAALTALGTRPAQAQVTLEKTFAPSTITRGDTSLLTLTIHNVGVAQINLIGTDNLPAGVEVTGSFTSDCGGTLTLSSTSIDVVGGTLSPGGSCSVSGLVTGVSSGMKMNTFFVSIAGGAVFSVEATLTVLEPTATATPTVTATVTQTATNTATSTVTATPTITPTPLPNGSNCTNAGQCASGNCVNTVCCDTACTDPLMRCNLPGEVGTCASAAASAPTLTPWGLLIGSVLLAGIAGVALRRRMWSR
jgi:hypothetical protein